MHSKQSVQVTLTVKMMKIKTVFVTFAILLYEVGGSELTTDEIWKKRMFCESFIKYIFDQLVTIFRSNAELREKYCEYEYVWPFTWGKVNELNNVSDAKPDGFKVKIEYTSVALKNTGIALCSEQMWYKIGEYF